MFGFYTKWMTNKASWMRFSFCILVVYLQSNYYHETCEKGKPSDTVSVFTKGNYPGQPCIAFTSCFCL